MDSVVIKYPSTEDRARLLGITNLGYGLIDYDPKCFGLPELESLMIQGLIESFCGQDRDDGGFEERPKSNLNAVWGDWDNPDPEAAWNGRAEAWAFKCMEGEQESFIELVKPFEGKPLSSYWDGVDEWLLEVMNSGN